MAHSCALAAVGKLLPYPSQTPSPHRTQSHLRLPRHFAHLPSYRGRRKGSRLGLPLLLTTPVTCVGGGEHEYERVPCPRPAEIPWKKELVNSVQLIGIIGAPVQIKHLSSGKVLAWTRLGVRKSQTETTWININLWDELAHVAFQHVEKGQKVYVSGRLVSDSVDGEQEKKVYYKVVVQQLNFIERTFPPVSLYNSDANSETQWPKAGQSQGDSIEELWQAFFTNPTEWWDNRKTKRNLKYPDFKHKDTGESLWIEGKYNPPWVKPQLAILDSRMATANSKESNSTSSMIYDDDFTTY